jgi:hypothetical protein
MASAPRTRAPRPRCTAGWWRTNLLAGIRVTAGLARASASLVTGNGTGLSNDGGGLETLGTNLVQGNGVDLSGPVTPVSGN